MKIGADPAAGSAVGKPGFEIVAERGGECALIAIASADAQDRAVAAGAFQRLAQSARFGLEGGQSGAGRGGVGLGRVAGCGGAFALR
ncbi:MAG TPA: hypothetical protein VF606_05260, partial [Geminicoccaceae bacterium]